MTASDDTAVIASDETRVLDVWDDAGERVVVEEHAPPPPPDRRRWWWPLALLAFAAAAALIGWLIWQNLDQEPEAAEPTHRAVPNVVGMDVDRAVDRLHELGFTTDVRRRRSEEDEGTVLQQRPRAGTQLEDGGEVLVVAAGGPQRVQVPRVVGLPLQEAVERLGERELEARPRSVFSDEPRGRVVRQVPAPGRRLEEGARVRLDVSRGPQRVAVPDVVGMPAGEAAAALRAAGFEAKAFEVPSEEPEGTVVAQSPLAGTQAAKGDAVRVNVSTGAPATGSGSGSGGGGTTTPAPRRVTMPDLIGADVREAAARLRELGLVVRVEYVPSQEPQRTVVAQRPTAGTSVPRGSQVRLNASEGPRPGARREVPDVVGLTEDEAREELESAGFEVEVVDEPTPDPAEDRLVVRQEPEAGSRAPRGALITLYVGRTE